MKIEDLLKEKFITGEQLNEAEGKGFIFRGRMSDFILYEFGDREILYQLCNGKIERYKKIYERLKNAKTNRSF